MIDGSSFEEGNAEESCEGTDVSGQCQL